MKVKELIEALQQFDQECKVMIEADRLDVTYGAITSVCENWFAKEPTVEITFDHERAASPPAFRRWVRRAINSCIKKIYLLSI